MNPKALVSGMFEVSSINQYISVPSCVQGWLEIWRHTSLWLANLAHSAKLWHIHFLMLSHHWDWGLPRDLLCPPACLLGWFFIIESWRLVWPKNFSFLAFIVFKSVFSVFKFFRTSSFFIFCFQLIFPICPRSHISHACILSISAFVNVHVSHPYRITAKT